MEAESAYMDALQAVGEISRSGDVLTLTGDDAELRFELRPPVPTAQLVGTRWELESLIEGTGEDGLATSAEPAYLLLHEDGTIEGTTGCRKLYGEWREEGDTILFGTFGAEGKCPARLRSQDGHVVGALGDGFRPEIDGDRLTIIGRFDQGLDYRAAD
jgi:heat shock protein HslJ